MTTTRTPPDLKWVANELAAVMGELAKLDEHLVVLNARRADFVRVRDSLERACNHPGRASTLNPQVLAKAAEEQLQLTFETDKQRADFIDHRVSRALRKLVAAGPGRAGER